MSNYIITLLSSKDKLPLDLLLLADETVDAIEKYIYDSDVYLVTEHEGQQPVAVFVLYRISDTEVELKNIAVLEALQGKGIGSYLIREIKRIAAEKNYKSIIAGTPDSAQMQLHFYEQNGFVKYAVKKDFFIENYPEPIIEDGVMLRDMVMLRIELMSE